MYMHHEEQNEVSKQEVVKICPAEKKVKKDLKKNNAVFWCVLGRMIADEVWGGGSGEYDWWYDEGDEGELIDALRVRLTRKPKTIDGQDSPRENERRRQERKREKDRL